MKPIPSPAGRRAPSRSAAIAQYAGRAQRYDAELTLFEPIRREAISALDLKRGDTVLDVGCGTGLSFELLHGRVGRTGRIVGVEQCPEMLAQARERVARHGWTNLTLIEAPAETARISARADAVLFHFTHDVLRNPVAVANVLAHCKPGARVVASGLQWAPPWAWPANGFVMLAAMYSVTSLEGLGSPWSLLEERLTGFSVSHTLFGGIYVAQGRLSPQ